MSSTKITGLHYFQTEGDVAVYHMYVSGNLAFKVYAFQGQAYKMDEFRVVPLSVATPDGGTVLTTAGFGIMHPESNRVSARSVQSYVLPRVAVIMGRLYVPGWEG